MNQLVESKVEHISFCCDAGCNFFPDPFPDSSVDDDRVRSRPDPPDPQHPDQPRHRVTQPEATNLGPASRRAKHVDAVEGRASQCQEPASL